MKNKDKKKQFNIKAINKMFELSGHDATYEDAQKIDKYYDKFTMTEEQNKQWEEWFIKESKKVFGFSTVKAKWEFSWFDMTYGLKINNKKNEVIKP